MITPHNSDSSTITNLLPVPLHHPKDTNGAARVKANPLPVRPVHDLLHEESVVVEPGGQQTSQKETSAAKHRNGFRHPLVGKILPYLSHANIPEQDPAFQGVPVRLEVRPDPLDGNADHPGEIKSL